jgi:membrane-associated phospholipid phosphatase
VIARRLWIVAGCFAVVALARSWRVGIPLKDPGGAFLVTRVGLSLGLFLVLAVIEALALTPRGERRPGALWAAHRRRWPAGRLATAWGCLLAYHLVYFAYHNLKSWDVLNAPRDHELTKVDDRLFLGHSPAVLLHDLLGQGVAAHVLLVVYEAFPTLVVLVVAGSVFTEELRDGATVLGSLIWVWILGTATYYAVPSLGPFYDRPQDFAGLPHTKATTTQAVYLAQRDQLLAHPHAPDAFAQVSAFASLHVGVTTVIMLMAAHLGYRRTARGLGVYLAVVCVATVYLGWHYAVDDLAGLAIGWMAVRLGIRTSGGGWGRAGRRGERQRAAPGQRRGMVTTKAAPSASGSSSISPPNERAIRRAIPRPRPAPPVP